ncbi:MAG: flagellar biosynthetic protein FliR [Phycisphaerae bacterium]
MPFELVNILVALPLYALILFRLGGLVMTAPLLSSNTIPIRVRAALAMTLAAMIFPVMVHTLPRGLTLADVVLGSVAEVMIGATIGLALSLVLLTADIAGMIVGQQGGLALGEIFDPTLNRRSTVTGQTYLIVLTIIFLVVGGHRQMVAALLDSFDAIPLMSFQYEQSVLMLLVEILSSAFVLGIRVAGPVLIALFLLGTALGFLSRTMPQFNILTIGFTVRLLVALGTAGLALAACRDLFVDSIWDGLALVRSTLALP